jgi:hypothetical protein
VNAASACRIAAAFSAGTKSDDVPELIGEAEAAAVSAGEASQCARAKALDPALSAKDVAIARHEMEDAAFRRDRMQTAETKLGERLRELRGQEEDHRRWLAYEKAKAARANSILGATLHGNVGIHRSAGRKNRMP